MSDHNSARTNEEDCPADDSRLDDSPPDRKDDQSLKSEIKTPSQVYFGRPRKHPYKPGKYKCEYCDVLCSKPSVLKKHVRAHTNERPYPCSICKRSFKTKSNLSKHMKSKSHFSKSRPPSIKEKAAMMLQAISGVDLEPPVSSEPTNSIEYDCVEKGEDSPDTSCDDRSVGSEDNSTEEMGKRAPGLDPCLDPCLDRKDELPEAELPSFSGMLTINAQSGPFTVEVEIKPETMKQLQHGLSTMNMKKLQSSSPGPLIMSRNDADVRAAESILHMANQRLAEVSMPPTEDRSSPVNVEHKLMAPKEENRRSEATDSPDAVCPSRPDYAPSQSRSIKASPLSYDSKSISRSRKGNKAVPNEDQRKIKKCLMESLLKKMQKKTSSQVDTPPVGSSSRGYSSYYVTESVADSSQISPGAVGNSCSSQKTSGTLCASTSPYKLNNLISESNSPGLLSLATSPGIQTVILQRSSPSSSQPPTSLPSNSAFILVPSFGDQIQRPPPIHSPLSSEVLSKPCQSPLRDLFVTTPVVIPMTPTMASSRTVNPLSHPIKEETTLSEREEPGSPENSGSTDDSERPSYNQQTSNQTTLESDSCSSPRLRIVEEDPIAEDNPGTKVSADSDEEIDVVNTDSDDNDSTIKRVADRSGPASTTKKRRSHRDLDGGLADTEPKRMKEMEKAISLHAPNINAKDLVQDCPLNLSANRQPNIPVCPQTPQILENLYGPMVAPSGPQPEKILAALTNTNPAHPTSLREAAPHDAHVPSNGHPLDYPIFEDKVLCEVCGQLIEPSKLSLHKSMHIYTEGKDQQQSAGQEPSASKQAFNKPRTYRCVVCNIGFRVMGHLSKHHKSKSHLQGLVTSGLLSKVLSAKIEEAKVPIGEIIDQKTGNIIPDVLSKYLSDWSHPGTDSDSG